MDKGANDFNGVFHIACYVGNVEIVKLLMEKGANNFDKALYSLCYLSCNGVNWRIVELLKENGAKFEMKYINYCLDNEIKEYLIQYC